MALFDEQEAAVAQLYRDGDTAGAIQKTIEVCRHRGPDLEPPALRDARCDLLMKILMAQITEGLYEAAAQSEETALLERRILNWKHGGRLVESEQFCTDTSFDKGYDDEQLVCLRRYVKERAAKGASTDHIKWLHAADKSIAAEVWGRFMQLKPDTLRIGCRILVSGLTRAPHLNGLSGTITCTQGERFGVILDSGATSAVKPANLQCKPQLATRSETNLQVEIAQAMMRLQIATDWMEAQPGTQSRREILHRIKLAHRVLGGECPPIKCAEPHELPEEGADGYERLLMKMKSLMRCHGSGTVNFLALGQMEQQDNGPIQPYKEWLLSGLCAVCQKKTFIV